MNKLFSAAPIWQNSGIFLVRIIAAFLLIYHGWEVFDTTKMQEYMKWDLFKSNTILPYIGKGAELAAGVLLLVGLFTRLSCLIIIGTFAYITFFVGNGKFWYEDQHPFLFILLALFFFFTGPGKWSVDHFLFSKK
jgi:putative oxidoreductase